MRIAAGVLLIIISLVNGCVGATATIFGGAATALSAEAAKQAGAADTSKMSAKDKAAIADAKSKLDSASGSVLIFGVALLLVFGLQLAAAICLFTQKAAKFIMIVGAIGALIGLWGVIQGDYIVSVASLAVSLLAIAAAKGMADEQGGGASAPA